MPLPYSGVQPVGEDAVAAALLSQIFPDTGLYMLPDPDMASADPEAYARMHREGPVVMANVVHGAGEPMQASASTTATSFASSGAPNWQ